MFMLSTPRLLPLRSTSNSAFTSMSAKPSSATSAPPCVCLCLSLYFYIYLGRSTYASTSAPALPSACLCLHLSLHLYHCPPPTSFSTPYLCAVLYHLSVPLLLWLPSQGPEGKEDAIAEPGIGLELRQLVRRNMWRQKQSPRAEGMSSQMQR